MDAILRQLRRAALRSASNDLSDAQLVECFLLKREQDAFAALLRRHGPMVMGVCQRILRDTHDAEDAFQATFLVLVRKVNSLRLRELLGNWLYGVAYRTAMKARAMNAKRRNKEKQALRVPALDGDALEREELLERLDSEMNRLPDKYRAAIVLCELEGKSRKSAARLLGLTEGALSWRLTQGRKLLARRLARHADMFVAGGLATVLSSADGSTSVSVSLLKTTASIAQQMAAGKALVAGAVSQHVLSLTDGVIKAMLLSKLKFVAMVAVVLTLGAGGVGWTYGAAEPKKTADTSQRRALDEMEALRLEVEALRKSLQVVRNRVEALENDVIVMKAQRASHLGAPFGGTALPGGFGMTGMGLQGGFGGMTGMGLQGEFGGMTGRMPGMALPGMGAGAMAPPAISTAKQPPATQQKPAGGGGSPLPKTDSSLRGRAIEALKEQPASWSRRMEADAVRGDIEKAIKLLRQHSTDKEATDLLERALQRLPKPEEP